MNTASDTASPRSRLGLWRSRVDYQGIILGVICTLVTLVLLVGAQLTKDTIALREAEDRLANLNQVLPAEFYDNDPLQDAIEIHDAVFASAPVDIFLARKQGRITALAFESVTQGYGGPLTLMLALDVNGTVLGVRVLSHRETPGLADKIDISRSNWIESFNGLSLANTEKPRWAVKKDGGQFDQFTGATITPRAVINGVVAALQLQARQQAAINELAHARKNETE